jgi:hypothetical protein
MKTVVKSKTLPRSWPKSCETTYIFEPVYSKSLDKETLGKLHSIPASGNGSEARSLILYDLTPGPSSLVTIKPIANAPNHPANGQHGLFASRKLPPGTFITCYLGFVHPSNESNLESNYDLSMDPHLKIAVDGEMYGNEARFINDYRGIATRANAEFQDVWMKNKDAFERRIGVVVAGGKNGIGKGEEILVSYGKGFWAARSASSA